jgi:hypothetical protein
MTVHRGIRFKIGEAFPSGSERARFVASVAVAHNDLQLAIAQIHAESFARQVTILLRG